MYIRTREQALDAMADVLQLRDPRDRQVQSTVKIMLCLDVAPRTLLVDAQALLLQGGLDALRRSRRDVPPDAGAVALALDALRFAETVRQIVPEVRHERWQIARTLLVNEAGVRMFLEAAIQARGDAMILSGCEAALGEMVLSLHQPWMDRAGTIRAACLDALRSRGLGNPEHLHPEADLLFELFAVSDERSTGLLDSLDRAPDEADRRVARLHEVVTALRDAPPDSPHEPPGRAGLGEVA